MHGYIHQKFCMGKGVYNRKVDIEWSEATEIKRTQKGITMVKVW